MHLLHPCLLPSHHLKALLPWQRPYLLFPCAANGAPFVGSFHDPLTFGPRMKHAIETLHTTQVTQVLT